MSDPEKWVDLYLFYYDGMWDWAEKGTDKDIPIKITYTEYLRLKQLQAESYEYE